MKSRRPQDPGPPCAREAPLIDQDQDQDQDYYARRAEDELSAASHATHEAARRIHLELSARYGELAGRGNERPDRAGRDELRLP
ncbi:hypothetical protein [Sphingomonas sp. LHG3406-1]|uniref:hypothetical protein n=1 Tax=Sphingomonas sp. LHG3406-1 TaxID=2804617 RepID=UPI0026082E67|nr:hypothetical protein [Sphingomonas sp. LHG3406-1]